MCFDFIRKCLSYQALSAFVRLRRVSETGSLSTIPNFIVFRSPYALEAAEPPVLPDRGAPAGRCPPRRSVKSPEGQAVRRVYPCSLLTLSYHVGGRCTIGKRLRRRKISSPSAQTGAGKPCGPHGPQGFLPMKLSPSYSCA